MFRLPAVVTGAKAPALKIGSHVMTRPPVPSWIVSMVSRDPTARPFAAVIVIAPVSVPMMTYSPKWALTSTVAA